MTSTAYNIRLLVEADVPAAMAILRDHFILEETIYRSFVDHNRGSYRNNAYELLTHALMKFLFEVVLKTHAAVVAVDRSDSTLVGLVVIHVGEFQNLQYPRGSSTWPTTAPDGILEKITYYLWDIRENAAVLAKFPDARNHMYFMYLTVRSDCRRRGLGTALVGWGMQWAKEHGFDLACGIFTSVPSKKIAERLGMRSVFDCDLRAVRNSKDEVVFADMGVNNIVSVMAIELIPTQENEVSTTN